MKVATETNPREVEGVWVGFQEGVEFLVARAGNPNFLRATDKIDNKFRKQIRLGKLSTAQSIENQCRAMAEGILLDWRGLVTEDGKSLDYDKDTAFAVLRHNPEVRDFVFEVATEGEHFRNEEIESSAKKSPSS